MDNIISSADAGIYKAVNQLQLNGIVPENGMVYVKIVDPRITKEAFLERFNIWKDTPTFSFPYKIELLLNNEVIEINP